jgi:hypothetical protein
MKKLSILTALLTAGALLAAHAADEAASGISDQLVELRIIFQQSLEKIEVDFLDSVDKCRDAYAISLNNAEDAATRQGDLEGVVQIRKEKVRFQEDRAVDDELAPGTHALIAKSVQGYLGSLENADRSRSQQIAGLAGKYMQHLESMKKQLTINKRIDDALVVSAEIKRAKADPVISRGLKMKVAGPGACPSCGGAKVSMSACADCKGSGACGYCQGTGMRQGLGGKGIPCFGCTGAKKCKKCSGKGQISQTCSRCKGKGRI